MKRTKKKARSKTPGAQGVSSEAEKKKQGNASKPKEEKASEVLETTQQDPLSNATDTEKQKNREVTATQREDEEFLKRHEEQVAQLQQAALEANMARNEMELALAEEQRKSANLVVELNTATESHTNIESQLEQCKNQNTDLTMQLMTLREQFRSKENEHTTAIAKLSTELQDSNRSKQSMQERMQMLETTLQSEHAELENYELQCKELVSDIDGVKASLDKVLGELRQCQEDKSKAEAEITSLQSELQMKTNMYSNEVQEHAKTKETMFHMETSLQDVVTNQRSMDTLMEKLKQEHSAKIEKEHEIVAHLKQENDQKTKDCESLQLEHSRVKAELEQANEAVKNAVVLEQRYSELSTELEDSKQRFYSELQEKEKRISDQQTAFDSLQAEYEGQRQRLEDLQEDRDAVRTDLEHAMKTIETASVTERSLHDLKLEMQEIEQKYKSEIQNFEQQLQERDKALAIAEESYQNQTTELRDLKNQFAVSDEMAGKRIAGFESALETERRRALRCETELGNIKEELQSKNAELEQAESDQQKLVHEYQSLQNSQQEIQSELDHTKVEMETIRTKLTKAIKKGKRIEEEKLALETQIQEREQSAETERNNTILALQSEIEQLKSLLEERTTVETQLREQLSDLEKREEAGVTELSNAESQIQNLTQQLQTKDSELQEAVALHQEVSEKESAARQKLQSAVKKGMRIENEKKQLEEQISFMAEKTAALMSKVPEVSSLQNQSETVFCELNDVQQRVNAALESVQSLKSESSRLRAEKRDALAQLDQLTRVHSELKLQFDAACEEKRRLENAVEASESKAEALSTAKENEEKIVGELREVIKANESKLVRAREAIEALRKERSDLNTKLANLTTEVTSLRSENANLQEQHESAEAAHDATERQAINAERKKVEELGRLKAAVEKKLIETDAKLLRAEKRNEELATELTTLQEEMNQQADPPVHAADPQVVDAVYRTASSLAHSLDLPFMDVTASTSDLLNAQLQSVQILLEGVSVGVQKNHEQLAHLPAALTELEQSKETIARLEGELLKSRAEAVTPGSSSAVDLQTPRANAYPQTSRVKRREVQDANESHVIDFNEISTEDGPEVKQVEYMPLVSVHAFRSAPPPVLHFMQTVDRQTQGAGRLLGHRPLVRAGVLAYALAIHIVLLVLIV